MLKRLRRQFVAIVMLLVGTVLIAVLGSSYVTSYRTQTLLVENSLSRTLHGGMDNRPVLGGERRDGLMGEPTGGLMGLLVDVDTDGVVLQASDVPIVVNTEILDTVIKRVLSDGMDSGQDKDLHVAWMSLWGSDDSDVFLDLDDYDQDDDGYEDELDDDTIVRIAIVDTAASDAVLREQAIKNLELVAVALLVLFAISWWLSSWALRPVENAWEQQRRFVADASHELKTPLAVILANMQILEADETLSEESRRWVTRTTDEARRMRALVGDLLQLARADETAAGVAQTAMRHDDVNLSDMVEGAALEFDAIAFERGCSLEVDVAQGVHVTGDPEWLDRLVRILIDNACKYAQVGTTVDVTLATAPGRGTLAVTNQGAPIPEEDLPHVFERFYRSDKARTRHGDEGGFGLGLAIAKGIVDAHGGKIGVSSSAAAGTTFTVTF